MVSFDGNDQQLLNHDVLFLQINNELNVPDWSKRKEMKKIALLIVWTVLTVTVTLTDHFLQLSYVKEPQSGILTILFTVSLKRN